MVEADEVEVQGGRIGLRIRFASGLVPVLRAEDDAIVHSCDERRDHWVVYDRDHGDDDMPFIDLVPWRGGRHGPSVPPQLQLWPSKLGSWHYYCEASELLPTDSALPSHATRRGPRLKQGSSEWIRRGHSGITMYLSAMDDWTLKTEARVVERTEGRTAERNLSEGDELWIEMYAERRSYPLLEISENVLALSYPTPSTWYLDVLERISKVQWEQDGNRITFFRRTEEDDPEPWAAL